MYDYKYAVRPSGTQIIISLNKSVISSFIRAQELCESRGGRPGLPVLMSLMVSVDVKQHFNQLLAALASVDFKQNVYLLLADG